MIQVNDVFPRLTSLALMGNPIWPATRSRARSPVTARKSHEDWRSSPGLGDGTVATEHGEGVGTVDRGAMHSWGGVEGTINEEGEGDGGERGEGREGDEAAYRLHVVKRLPGLVTLDCVDVTEEERARAKEVRSSCHESWPRTRGAGTSQGEGEKNFHLEAKEIDGRIKTLS